MFSFYSRAKARLQSVLELWNGGQKHYFEVASFDNSPPIILLLPCLMLYVIFQVDSVLILLCCLVCAISYLGHSRLLSTSLGLPTHVSRQDAQHICRALIPEMHKLAPNDCKYNMGALHLCILGYTTVKQT